MKTIIKEVELEGLDSLLGKKVTLLCCNYFYTGELVGVNSTCVKLENPSIVYETGPWNKSEWADSQSLPCKYLYVQISSIECFGELK